MNKSASISNLSKLEFRATLANIAQPLTSTESRNKKQIHQDQEEDLIAEFDAAHSRSVPLREAILHPKAAHCSGKMESISKMNLGFL